MSTVRVFCIDGVIVEILREAVSDEAIRTQSLIPIELQKTMRKVLAGQNIELLSPITAAKTIIEFGGRMVEDRNTETFADVSEDLDGERTEWP